MEKVAKKLGAMDPEERDKLHKLLKEDKSGEKDDPLTWMYKQYQPDKEEYLLGRPVDKYIEEENKVEEDENAPGALFEEAIARRADIDMQAKMREDPLYAIKKQEEDAKRKLLSNPIKIKQLEKLIQEKDKKTKKKKKKHKHRHGDDEDEDDLLKKFLEIRRQKELKGLKRSKAEEDEDSERQSRKKGKEDKKKHREESSDRRRERSPERRRHHSPERHRDRSPQRHRDRDPERHRDRSPQRHRDKSPPGRRDRSPERHRDDSAKDDPQRRRRHSSGDDHSHRHGYGLVGRDGRPIETKTKHKRSRSRSPVRKYRRESPPKKPIEKSRKKLTSEEKERRREEMLQNAKSRDVEREQNVKRYKEEMAKEKDDHASSGSAGSFLNPMIRQHASETSVADRIKRNIYNVQRTNADLDKKFTKK